MINMYEGPRIKICGITNLEDARYCAGAGADYLGYIQYRESPRYIPSSRAQQIIEWIHGIQAVGVFVNEDAKTVNRIAADTGFAMVQASGSESPEWCAQIDLPVIKAIHVEKKDSASTLLSRMLPYHPHVSHILLDSGKSGMWGGTGETFDWRILSQEMWMHHRFFVAGGLDPSNVQEAIEIAAPFGIDLSSGVESAPGRKDYRLVDSLFDKIRPES
jgi:phosphoribosylanthranilate isomerase